LLLNFRSQPPLVNFFNHLFERLFRPKEEIPREELAELGYVAHEPSEAKRELRDEGPLVELIVSTEMTEAPQGEGEDQKAEQSSRELDAQQLAQRIRALVGSLEANNESELLSDRSGRAARGPITNYSDIALLFRAMTNVQIYESAFRRANIPYQTVLGRGFYEREEITDLIQLLRFLDNKTDELALAAVLRSPLCGLSDNGLLALRCAPLLEEVDTTDSMRTFSATRKLYAGLRH